MFERQRAVRRFEIEMLPHLNAAYALARRLLGEQRDAEDVVQEAYLRAFRFFDGFRGGDGRVWILAIVRNACYDWLRRYRMPEHRSTEFLEELHTGEVESADAEASMIDRLDAQELDRALNNLPTEFREILVLRELEGLTYKEISSMVGVPMGTVMSRLARARQQLKTEILKRRD